MNVIECLRDRALFGASTTFRDLAPWNPWLTFLGGTYGLPLDPEGVELFKRCTGRSTYDPPDGGWPEVVCVVGRQAGKTRVASLISAFEAAMCEPSRDGELYSLCLAQDLRAAIRTSFSYIRALFEASAILSRSIANVTADTLELTNGVRVAAYACRPSAIRGLRARVAVCDELAFFRSTEWIPQDTEMIRAVRPCLATTGGKLIVLSSPYGQSGALWNLHRKHHGRDDSPVLVWQATAPEMNPTLPADYLERMREEDPEAFRSEVLGEFRRGLSTLLDPDVIDDAVDAGRRESIPAAEVDYSAFVDPSGGRRDAFTLAIGHRDEERGTVDLVRAWRPPFNPSGVVEECASSLRRYSVTKVAGDRYAGEWPREQFRAHGIAYEVALKPKSDLYLDLLATLNSHRLAIPEEPTLIRELRALERRRGSSGRDRVDHPAGVHDDLANAVAGVAHLLFRWEEMPQVWVA